MKQLVAEKERRQQEGRFHLDNKRGTTNESKETVQSGSGILMYTRTSLQATPANLPLTVAEPFQDEVWCEIRLRGNDKLLIGFLYISPNSYSENNTRKVKYIQAAISRGHSHGIVMGDLSHPELDCTTGQSLASINHPSSTFLEAIRDTYLHQHITQPTPFRGTQHANTLDTTHIPS